MLKLLRASSEPRGILSLAEELGVHANTVRFHLTTLVRAGQVEQVLGDTTGAGRPPALFRTTHRMNPRGPTNYQLLAAMLTGHLAKNADPQAVATELGRSWGAHLVDITAPGKPRPPHVRRGEALTWIIDELTNLGFAPEAPRGPRDSTIRLRHCPFLELVTGAQISTDNGQASGYGAVICSLHLGLMQGSLASLHGPMTVDRLDPFVEPDLCVAHLTASATASLQAAGDEEGA